MHQNLPATLKLNKTFIMKLFKLLCSLFAFYTSVCSGQRFINDDEKVIPRDGLLNSKYVKMRNNPESLNLNLEFRKKGIYYSNGQLFSKTDKKGISLSNPIYYENGNFWNGLIEDEEDHGLMRLIELSPDGAPIVDIPYEKPTFKPEKDSKYGMREAQYHIKNPKMYSPTEGNWYYGYDEVGYFQNGKHNYIFTGYFFPMISYYSNGSVLFMEDVVAKKNYWVVVLDNEIKFKIEVEGESPDIVKLKENTDFEHYKLVGAVPYIFTKNFSKRGGLQYHDNHCFSLITKNIATLNGYGINYTTPDNLAPCDELNLEIGVFKNGKLNGVGMQSQIIRGHDARYDWGTPSLAKDDQDYTVHIVYGIFEDGKPVDVRKIDVVNSPIKDFWDVIPIAGFKHKDYLKPSGTLFPNTNIPLNSITTGDELFIEEITRTAKVASVDLEKNSISVYTDTPGILAEFDASYDKPLYVRSFTKGAQTQTCATTIRRPKYRKESQQIGTTTPTIKSNRYVVKGVYYDKIVSTTVSSPAKPIYGIVDVFDGYEEYICTACNGKGYVSKEFTNTNWRQITFD